MSDMELDEFRKYGRQVIDWIADYFAHPERYPVLSQVKPGWIRKNLPKNPPEEPESMDVILRDMEQYILPGVTHWNHPAFFAYFAISGSGPGILGELLSAAFNVNAMLWKTAPAATELEEIVLDWLRQMLGLPDSFMGIINDTASVSTLCAMVAAREAITDFKIRKYGLTKQSKLPRLRLYTSEQAHSSVEKAAIVIGIGEEGVRKVPTDDEFRMDPQALKMAINEDISEGWQPFCVVATVGTTSTTSIDPVMEIAGTCDEYKLWLHVDAAYAGTAAIIPEMQYVLDGCDHADSIVVNPHKWLFAPIDISAFYCRKPDILRRTFSLVPEYLKTAEGKVVHNYMDYGIQLGRRFRALKLWMIIRYFGKIGIIDRLKEHISMAKEFAGWVDESPNFERLAPVPFSVVCFRANPWVKKKSSMKEEAEKYLNILNEKLLNEINATGRTYLSHTYLSNKFTLRLAIGNIRTTREEVKQTWNLLQKHFAKLDKQLRPIELI